MFINPNHYRFIHNLVPDMEQEDAGYFLFKCFCAIYAWNYKLYKRIRSYFDRPLYMEPFEPYWINYLSMEKTPTGYVNQDLYHMFRYLDVEKIQSHYQMFYDQMVQDKYNQIPETLFLVKSDVQYISRTWNVNKPYNDLTIPCKSCNFDFLYIEYNHPSMNHTIELTIPEPFYTVDNEICSCAFFLRLLEKQSQSYVFDSKYFVTILDHNMERITLTMHHYIRLQKDRYTIETNDFMTEHLEYENAQEEMVGYEHTFFPMVYTEWLGHLSRFVCVIHFLSILGNLFVTQGKKQRVKNVYVEESESESESESETEKSGSEAETEIESEIEEELESESEIKQESESKTTTPDSFELVHSDSTKEF